MKEQPSGGSGEETLITTISWCSSGIAIEGRRWGNHKKEQPSLSSSSNRKMYLRGHTTDDLKTYDTRIIQHIIPMK